MYKQVIIVRKDLNMSPGKLAAQVSHASMAFLSWTVRKNALRVINANLDPVGRYHIEFDMDSDLYEQWLDGVFTKLVMQAKNKSQLLKAVDMANALGMKEGEDYFLIRDNCYTELTPEEVDENGVGRTLTCIGFRPMDAGVIDQIGKKYHLYT